LLVENFLLPHWQLRTLNESLQLAATETTTKATRELQRRLIFGLEKFHRSSLAFGSAQQIVARFCRSQAPTVLGSS
jgi:hypothetical protein